MIDYGNVNTSGANANNYPHSMDINFTPTPSPLPAQKQAYNDYNTAFTGFLNSQETVPQLQARYQNRYNIPFLQTQAQQQGEQMADVGNQLQALPLSVASDSQNSTLTQGQKDAIVQSRSVPLTQEYNTMQTAYGNTSKALGVGEQNMNSAITAEQAQQMKMTQPWLQKYDAMTIFNAAENTQWTQTNQWELSRLLANQSAGVTLSEGQQNRMEQLAYQENAFNNQLKLLDKQNSMAMSLFG